MKYITTKEDKILYRKLKTILRETSKGKHKCLVDLPNFRKVKAEIVGFDFRNIIHRPIEVHFLEGMQREESYIDYEEMAWGMDENNYGVMKKRQVSYEYDWVSVNQIELEK